MPLLYDPRINRRIITNNDALIMANIMVKSNLVVKDKQFWNKIKKLANYADSHNGKRGKKKNLV